MPERKGRIIVNPRILDREDRRDGMSTMSLEDARRAIARGTARLRAAIDAREDEDMQLGPIEDGPRYPVIAYSQVPEDGSDVGQAGQNLDEKADVRAGESIDGFYGMYPYLGRPVSEDDWNRVEEFRVGLLQRNEERAGLALHDFYNRNPWL